LFLSIKGSKSVLEVTNGWELESSRVKRAKKKKKKKKKKKRNPYPTLYIQDGKGYKNGGVIMMVKRSRVKMRSKKVELHVWP